MRFSGYTFGDGYEKRREKECEKQVRKDDDGVYDIRGSTAYKAIDGLSKQKLEGLLLRLLPEIDLNKVEYRCLKLRRVENGKSVLYYAPIIAVQAAWVQYPEQIRRFPIIRGTRTPVGDTEEGRRDAALKDLAEAMKKFAVWDQAKGDLDTALTFNRSVDVTDLFGWPTPGMFKK